MTEANRVQRKPHNLIMENRAKLSISGVNDVDNFDGKQIIVYTEMGQLAVKGGAIHISHLSTESGELVLEGKIDSLVYLSDGGKRVSGIGRMFR